MATRQILLRLPDELARRFQRTVPARRRSAFVQRLLEDALPSQEGEHDPLYLAALEVERDECLSLEMAEWDLTVGDGFASAEGKGSLA